MGTLTADMVDIDGIRFSSIWLRDNCQCAECRDPGLAITPHTDNPYRDPVPSPQLLHCLSNAAEGGESGLVDGFKVASLLRERDPESFDILARTPVPFAFRDKEAELHAHRPIIEVDGPPPGRLRRPRLPGEYALRSPPESNSMTESIEVIANLFANEGEREYFGEAVTQAMHMLQAATLAEAAGAPDSQVAAALLHDVGHFRGILSGRDLMAGTNNRHEEAGAAWLSQWFGPEVTEPVRLHVPAKRYLCAVDPAYFGKLSEASVFTLKLQGGPMTADELKAFEAEEFANEAVAVRRWDEAAKDPTAATPRFDHFRSLLERLLRS